MRKIRKISNFFIFLDFLKIKYIMLRLLRTTRHMAADHRLRTADLKTYLLRPDFAVNHSISWSNNGSTPLTWPEIPWHPSVEIHRLVPPLWLGPTGDSFSLLFKILLIWSMGVFRMDFRGQPTLELVHVLKQKKCIKLRPQSMDKPPNKKYPKMFFWLCPSYEVFRLWWHLTSYKPTKKAPLSR